MGLNNNEWLPFLEKSIPIEAQGHKVSSYAIALEGWRRGLTVKYYNRESNIAKIRYSLTYKGREHFFAGARGDLVKRSAVRICMNKHLTKKHLKEANVPTPEGARFKKEVPHEEIVDYGNTLGYPLVVKPVSGSGGKGVIAGIKNESEFKQALRYVRDELRYEQVIVERFFVGNDYRVYAIGDKVVAAFDRVPANVIGDGKSTISELLDRKIMERQTNPALYNRPIMIDNEVHTLLERNNLSMESILEKDRLVYLKTKNNVSSGGDSRDVTDQLSDNIKKIAVEGMKAIPGLVQAGIDIIIDEKNDTGVILEINSRPSIRNHLFPMIGTARDIPKAIIDYYFPETKDCASYNSSYYFDIQSVHDVFQKGFASEITIPKVPNKNDVLTRFIVVGAKQGEKYESWIQRRIRRYNLNGYLKYLDQNTSVLVVAGSKINVVKFQSVVNKNLPRYFDVQSIVKKDRKSPVKMGFEVIKDKQNIKNKIQSVQVENNKPNKIMKELRRGENLQEASFVIENEEKNIGLKSSLIEYAAIKKGLNMTRLSRSTIVIERENKKPLGFIQLNGISSSRVGKGICDKKHFTRSILKSNGFTVVESDIFKYKQLDKAKSFVEKLGFPVVVKPVYLSRGRGITTNINSLEELEAAWKEAFAAYKGSKGQKSLIVERHFVGEDYRFFVVGDKVISASQRKRANVVGNGSSTVLELIKEKNIIRAKNPYLKKYLIPESIEKLDRLKKEGIDLNYKPLFGEEVILRSQSNLSAGGDSIDVTHLIHSEYHKIAVNAVKSIPGLNYAGVDFIMPDITVAPNHNNHIVSEIEFSPAPFNHFHFEGKNYDYAGAILDFYLKN